MKQSNVMEESRTDKMGQVLWLKAEFGKKGWSYPKKEVTSVVWSRRRIRAWNSGGGLCG